MINCSTCKKSHNKYCSNSIHLGDLDSARESIKEAGGLSLSELIEKFKNKNRTNFEDYVKVHRKDLDLQHTYDSKGNYHYDGYIWSDTTEAFRLWEAAIDSVKT